jgi:hypothetical protein
MENLVMPRDGAGNYTLPSGNPVISGTTILADWANTTMPDMGATLTDSLSRSGQGGMLVPLKFVDGTALEPAMTFTGEPSLGMFRPATGVIGFAGGAVELARIKLDGNISVSGAAPDADGDLTRKDYVDALVIPFSQYLAGYEDTGLHTPYTGDLNDIAVNSCYKGTDANTTNTPPSGVGFSYFITTDLSSVGNGNQVLIGYSGTALYQVWQRQIAAGAWDAWKLVVDGGAFTERLAGYLDTDGLLEQWVGSLDDVQINSTYSFNAASNTGLPAGITTEHGYFETRMRTITRGVQTLYSAVNSTGIYQIWMRKINTTWTDWVLVVDGGAMTLRLAGYLDDGFHENSPEVDCDDVLWNSDFIIQSTLNTNVPPGMVSGDVGWMVTELGGGPANAIQTVQVRRNLGAADDTPTVWMRTRASNTWGTWYLVIDGGAFTQRLAGLNDDGFSIQWVGDVGDIDTNSFYQFGWANATGLPNDITEQGGYIRTNVGSGGPNGQVQTIYGSGTANTHKIWMRTSSSGVWDAWVLVVDGPAQTMLRTGTRLDITNVPT